jgi:hypothetical protein
MEQALYNTSKLVKYCVKSTLGTSYTTQVLQSLSDFVKGPILSSVEVVGLNFARIPA